MAQITGRVYIKTNGKLLRSKDGAKLINVGGVERPPVTGNAVYGYVEKTVAPGVEFTVADTADFSLKEIHAMTNVTVTLETDTGKTYVLRNAWCEGAMALTAGEGDVECKFSAEACEEMMP